MGKRGEKNWQGCEEQKKHVAIRSVMYAEERCVSMTDACLMHDFFFFSNPECFLSQSGNKRANTCAAL